MTEVMARAVAPSNIQKTVVMAHLTNVLGQPNEWEEMLPDWGGGHIFTGINEQGVPEFMSTRGLNPFLDVFDPIQQPHGQGLLRPLSPAFQMGYEQVSGNRVLTGRSFSSPGQPFGMTPETSPRPPIGEQLVNQVPQLGAARDVYREMMGQPLTRYGTGEAGYFGEDEGRSSLQSLRQIFGVNIQPLNVEDIQNREKVFEYRQAQAEAQYEAQARAHGGRRLRDMGGDAVDKLQSLPLIPGGS